jgi:hypothetical protein
VLRDIAKTRLILAAFGVGQSGDLYSPATFGRKSKKFTRMIQPLSKAFLPRHRYGGWTPTLHKGKWNMFKQAIAFAVAAYIILSASAALAQGTGETVRIQDYPATGNMLYRVAIASQ